MGPRRERRVGGLACTLAVLAWPTLVQAQFTEAPLPAAYALRNVSVVAADGARRTGVTLVVRGSLIEALAAGAAVPDDAQVLEGDSLMVYPGLVDAWGTVKYDFPKDSVDRSKVKAWNPPRSVQGFEPHRRVVDYLTATGSDVAELRRKGIVAVAVQPDGALMPGRGALVLLRKGADDPQDLVVDATLGPVMTFSSARGAYPTTMMGMIAWYRQTFLDAQRRAQVASAAERDPHGVTLPAYDPDYTVVQEAIGGGTPVYWVADDADDIRRMLRIADEFRLRPTLVGGAEAWKLADELKARDISVFVSVDFPKPKEWKAEPKTAAPKPGAVKPPADTVKAVGDTASLAPETAAQKPARPPLPGALREKKRLEETYANAGKLAAAGVRFALVSNQGKADLLEGARKAIEYGLSESDALRALTATPASLYHIASVARIEKDLPATFIVTDGPLFDADTKVVYTFVEGALEKGASEGKNAPSGDASAAATVAGTWTFEILASDAPPPGTLKVTQSGATFTGTLEVPGFGTMPIESGRIDSDEISFTVTIQQGGESATVDFSGTVGGASISGSGSGEGVGDFDWRAARTAGPGGR